MLSFIIFRIYIQLRLIKILTQILYSTVLIFHFYIVLLFFICFFQQTSSWPFLPLTFSSPISPLYQICANKVHQHLFWRMASCLSLNKLSWGGVVVVGPPFLWSTNKICFPRQFARGAGNMQIKVWCEICTIRVGLIFAARLTDGIYPELIKW